jgi:DNA-binding winged helix-turn-helix (wHTH) protein
MARGDRSVDVFVRKLRQKLERLSPDWRYVHTHFGVGYRFHAEPVNADQPASIPAPQRAQAPPAPPPLPAASGRESARAPDLATTR